MSHLKNQVVPTWEVIEDYFRCAVLRRNGQIVEGNDLNRIRDAYTLFVLALDDLLTVPGSPSFNWPFMRFCCSLKDADVADVMKTYKAADDLLLSVYHGKDGLSSYDDFKHHLKSVVPNCGALIAPLKGLLAAWTCSQGSCTVFWQLHTAFNFMSRIRFDICPDLQERALQDYLKVESSFPTSFTEEEEKFFARWFPDTLDLRERLYTSHVGRHGPGSVAENIGRDFVKKYRSMGSDSLTDYLDMVIGHDPVTWQRASFDRCARVVFVPKTALKLRTICMEPATLQWYQQGFSRSLDDYVRSCGLRNRISLQNQGLNRELAREGSITGEMVTIDLSAASDSVCYEMVRQWTYNTALMPMVKAGRSTHVVLPDDTVVKLNKFAPMGSALCFPFECLVFCSIVEAAIQESGGRYQLSRYRVYGDDIIVERQYVDAVIRRLNINGFRVNSDKSFYHTGDNVYRESCGGEYLNGNDVTPLRLARHFNGWSAGLSSPQDIERLVALCNATFGLLPSVRRFVIKQLLKLPTRYLPMFSDDFSLIGEYSDISKTGKGIFSLSATNYLSKSRWNTDFQVREWLTYTNRVNQYPEKEDDGEVLFYEYLRETRDRQTLLPEDRVDIRGHRTCGVRLGSTWS